MLPGARCGADDGGEGGGHQQGEEDQVEQTLHPIVADADKGVQVVLWQERGWDRAGGVGGVTPGDAHPYPGPPLTLCSPRQSSMAVSWCRLVSEELRSCWTPSRSFCRRGRGWGVRAALGGMGSRAGGTGRQLPPPRTSAVGKRGSANCIRPWIWICMVVSERWKTVRACKGGARSGHGAARGHPQPQAAQGGVPAPPYLLEGVAQALVTVQVIVNHLCKANGRRRCEHPGGQRAAQGGQHGSGELRTPCPKPPHRFWGSTGVPALSSSPCRALGPALTRADVALRLVHDELIRSYAEVAGALWGQKGHRRGPEGRDRHPQRLALPWHSL